jgi:hypothetical protein
MKTRQLRKARAREEARRDPLHSHAGFVPIMNQIHKSGMNRHARRGAVAGWFRSPKGGVNWRQKQWIWGMIHHPRRLDRRCFKATGRYLAELAEALPGFVAKAKAAATAKKESLLRRALTRLGY